MTFKLISAVKVAADPSKAGYTPNLMVELPAGTLLGDISEYELAQLAPGHFVDDAGNEPDDWRHEAAQAQDVAQIAAMDQHLAGHNGGASDAVR